MSVSAASASGSGAGIDRAAAAAEEDGARTRRRRDGQLGLRRGRRHARGRAADPLARRPRLDHRERRRPLLPEARRRVDRASTSRSSSRSSRPPGTRRARSTSSTRSRRARRSRSGRPRTSYPGDNPTTKQTLTVSLAPGHGVHDRQAVVRGRDHRSVRAAGQEGVVPPDER